MTQNTNQPESIEAAFARLVKRDEESLQFAQALQVITIKFVQRDGSQPRKLMEDVMKLVDDTRAGRLRVEKE